MTFKVLSSSYMERGFEVSIYDEKNDAFCIIASPPPF
jgi:hypothetical protein